MNGGNVVMTLDQAVDAFHSNPNSNTAKVFNRILQQYHHNGMIEADTFNKYFEEVVTFFLVEDPINRLWQ